MRRRCCGSRLQNHGNPALSHLLRFQIMDSSAIRVENHCEAVPTAPHVHCWHVCQTQQSCDQKQVAYFRRHPCVQLTIAAITVPCISRESGKVCQSGEQLVSPSNVKLSELQDRCYSPPCLSPRCCH